VKRFNSLLAVLALVATMAISSTALAAKTYQVTGVVVKLTDKIITIEKGTGSDKEKWEIDRDSDTKITGTLKEGAKVTIEYTMSAKSVDVK
jgi:cell division protein FtsL